MGIQLKNNAVGYLATAITASDTGIVLQTGNGAGFPTLGANDYFYATLESSGGTLEVIKVTARSGDSLTVQRAQDGTSANSFAAGARFEMRVNAKAVIDTIYSLTNYQGGSATNPTVRLDGTPLQAGDFYFNTSSDSVRFYNGASWQSLTTGSITVQNFTGNGSTTIFTLATAPTGEDNTQVYLNGVYQQKNTYSISGTSLTFSVAPPLGATIEVVTIEAIAIGSTTAGLVSYTPPFTGSVATNVGDKLAQYVSVLDFGASSSNTNAQNKSILQTAIFALNLQGGGLLVVPPDINYGYAVTSSSTHPSFSGVTSPIQIFDYSPGNSYSGYPTAYDGAQVRLWQFTPQTTSPGQHDGNTYWQRAAWAPAYLISNDGNLAPVGNPSRTADDNRRASLFFANDGAVTWRVGQGTLTGASYTDQQLSNFTISAFGDYGGATVDGTSAMLIDRVTGNFGFNTDPAASYHFKSKVTGYGQGLFESITSDVDVTLRNSAGSSQDVSIQNFGGVCRIATKGSLDFVVKGAAYSTKGPTSITGTTYAVVDKDTDLIVAASGPCTITLPAASGCTGRVINVLTRNAQAVSSAASNVIGLTGGAAGTTILAATAGKWARLISDGGYWQINMAN